MMTFGCKVGWIFEMAKMGFYHVPLAGHDVQLAGHHKKIFAGWERV
jgi:hypothetical protein